MNDYVLARALHVVGVVLWIGGVAMVTTVIMPAVRHIASPEERAALFETLEGRFAKQARWFTLLTGATGFYMLYLLEGWSLLLRPSHWWLVSMIVVWALFTLMLFVLEPLFLHAWFERNARLEPEKTFSLMHRLHWVLLVISLITVLGGVAGAHGLLLFL